MHFISFHAKIGVVFRVCEFYDVMSPNFHQFNSYGLQYHNVSLLWHLRRFLGDLGFLLLNVWFCPLSLDCLNFLSIFFHFVSFVFLPSPILRFLFFQFLGSGRWRLCRHLICRLLLFLRGNLILSNMWWLALCHLFLSYSSFILHLKVVRLWCLRIPWLHN